MSISMIGSNSFNNNSASPTYQLKNSEFMQLGQDLAAGNISAAQTDFATLQQALSQIPAGASTTTANPVAQAFSQLSSDLKSGNVAAAQQDYSTIQQDMKQGFDHGHFAHRISGWTGASQTNVLEMNQLGQDFSAASLFAGNTNAAQQAYATMASAAVQPSLDTGALDGVSLDGVSMVA